MKDSAGRVLHERSELKEGSEIFCEAESDPASELSLSGDALADVGEAVCEPEGDGWLCTSSAIFSTSGEVQCVARQPALQTERCAGGDTCILIYIQSKSRAMLIRQLKEQWGLTLGIHDRQVDPAAFQPTN
jgi:hypothetical protein